MQKSTSSKLNAAIELARAGFSVFPLIPNGKRPLIENWRNLATTDESTICQWWAERADANIGVQTDRLIVIDIDPRKGGGKSFEALALYRPFPKTARVSTPSGGDHLYYKLPENIVVRGGVNVLGDGIDIRSYGGLAAAPGSAIDRTPYKWGNNNPIAVAPEWLIEQCRKPRQRNGESAKRVVAEDATAVQLAWQWMVDHAPEANEGNRDDTGFKVAARFYDFGVTLETCLELLSEWNATKCHPSLEAEDIERLARSASTNRDNAIGNRHPEAPGFEAVTIAERSKPVANTTKATRGLHYVSLDEGAELARKIGSDPLVEGMIDCNTMVIMYGESNSGKTFTLQDMGFHVSADLPWAGRVVKQGTVVYVAAEGGRGIYKRLAALRAHHTDAPANVPFFVIPCPVDLRRSDADLKPLIEMIADIEAKHGKVVLVCIDTLSRVIAGGDENSPVDMGLMVKHFDAIREAAQATVAVVHHTGKDAARGARGHSLLRAATDTEIEIANHTITFTKQRDLDTAEPLRFSLKTINVGIDDKGQKITSCWVEVRQKTDVPGEPEQLTGEVKSFADAIEKELLKKCDTNLKVVKGQMFTTALAIKCGTFADAQDRAPRSKAMRNHVNRLMLIMLESGWVQNTKKGQWVWLHAHNAQNAQAELIQ